MNHYATLGPQPLGEIPRWGRGDIPTAPFPVNERLSLAGTGPHRPHLRGSSPISAVTATTTTGMHCKPDLQHGPLWGRTHYT